MARRSIPDALEMTRLKYGKDVPTEDRDRVAEALREQGRRSEALLLYEGRPDAPAVAEEAAWAVREGSAFTLAQVGRLGFPVTDDHRRACAQAAEAKGRLYDAYRLYEALGDAVALERLRATLPDYRPAVPDNKK